MEEQLINGLKNEESWAYEIVYKKCYSSIHQFIIKNQGTSEDAKNITQETIYILIKSLQQANFIFTWSSTEYFLIVANALWFKDLN